MTPADDRSRMCEALALAARAIGNCEPNPRVGCVLTDAAGRVLGTGHTQEAGGPHAEIMALRDAAAQGHSVAGATAYVTLEPCAHQGRTGPCCDALVQAGIARVVASLGDPNPLVGGQGFGRLRAAGVVVDIGLCAEEARELNLGFFSRMQRKTPWVRLKVAASLDGKTALDNGASQWITSPEARADGHAWRARAGAILTGIGTIREDNPRLDVRLVPCPQQPPLVVIDSRLETPPDAQLFIEGRPVWVYAAVPDDTRARALAQRGATVRYLPGPSADTRGKVDLRAVLLDLAQRGVNELHVEAGHKLNGSLLREGLVDELLLYLAPTLIGQGRDMAAFGPLARLDDALALEFISTGMVGPDLRLVARPAGRARF
jgi:diaminohydroxyphosphoribosylaminopyrimidine deaminase/5-amino-6-(5-phosphoribosylamino)uracil reductase